MHISGEVVATWFNFLRDNQDDPEVCRRYYECFWESQLQSKQVVLDMIDRMDVYQCYIFGGWYGLLAQILHDSIRNHHPVVSVDIDPKCAIVINNYFNPEDGIVAHTGDMATYKYIIKPELVINCSTEHVDQKTYDAWFDRIPLNTEYIIQGNNLDIPEHIRLADDINHFKDINRCTKVIDKKVTDCPGPNGIFQRYTIKGIKV